MQFLVTIKYVFSFTIKYTKYLYYGFKQRLYALFRRDLSIIGFIKSLFKIPFESYQYTIIELEEIYNGH